MSAARREAVAASTFAIFTRASASRKAMARVLIPAFASARRARAAAAAFSEAARASGFAAAAAGLSARAFVEAAAARPRLSARTREVEAPAGRVGHAAA